MAGRSNRNYWIVWSIASLLLVSALAYTIFAATDKTLFMPGPLSPGHHQLAESCDSCHSDGFGGGEVLQEACVQCHGNERQKPQDSHPRTKFTDPRNADRLEKINALQCVTCHVEHRPEITLKDGLTQPRDVCFHCHADIGEERPSHQGMEFTTCKDSGCHNFHNNRALYTDFLTKHMDAVAHAEKPLLPAKDFSELVAETMEYPHDRYPLEALNESAADAPDDKLADSEIVSDWLTTRHSQAGVNCSACHQPLSEDGEPGEWRDKPGVAGCNGCHQLEIQRFQKGKHGMRLAAGLSPMTPEQALLPMQEDAAHQELTCSSCHGSHRFDVTYAAVDACLGCHADEHSLAYQDSPHYQLWQAEVAGEATANSGVSCATCHMPRIDFDVNDWMSRVMVDHNQSAALSPNSKMIRPACIHCHGLGFAIDALADVKLIQNNFSGQPGLHVLSIDMARSDLQRYLEETTNAQENTE